jgi:hypothetical protein
MLALPLRIWARKAAATRMRRARECSGRSACGGAQKVNPFLLRRSEVEEKRWHPEAELDLLALPPFTLHLP